ncbi:MAG: low temperature requirement protein A [Actinomycetales bacterium]|nr:low temperature requirement protein A [Actinomycetales bacterium]
MSLRRGSRPKLPRVARAAAGRLHLRMDARDPAQEHRAATPLELLFDLVFVVAIAQLVGELAHAAENGHPFEAIGPFAMVFFAIWWAWMGFTWFASAYDTDDVLYRVLAAVQMAGVLVIAAGVPAAFSELDFTGITIGYLVMRVGLVASWLRAAIEHRDGRRTALGYAIGISIVQALWILWRLLELPDTLLVPVFVVLAASELVVPFLAERSGMTTWHPHHIAERYGLFVIILLGESVLASTVAVQVAVTDFGVSLPLVVLGISGFALLFGVWWYWFLQPAGDGLEQNRQRSFVWGYGHYVLFAALAALGGGLEIAIDASRESAELSPVVAAGFVGVPLAVILAGTWVLHRALLGREEFPWWIALPGAALALAAPFAAPALGLWAVVALLALLVAVVVALAVAAGARRKLDEALEGADAASEASSG